MHIAAALKKWKAKLGFSGAIVVTLWMLNTYPPSDVVWHYIAWRGVVPGVWLIALLIWTSARIKRRVYFVGLSALFSIWIAALVVLWPIVEPLQIKAFYIPAKYAAGSVIGGIPWEDFYTDVRVQITNPSDADYKDVDVLINATDAIDRIAQISSIPCVELVSASDPSQRPRIVGLNTAAGEVIPAQGQRFSRDGYRLRCTTFPRKSTVEVILATVNMNSNPIATSQLFGPKRPPAKITVQGQYIANQGQYQVQENLPIAP